MTIKTVIVDVYSLDTALNNIGWENVLQILPEHRYDDTLFVIIYKKVENEKIR